MIREDLAMSVGKCSSQAGHAYLEAYLQSNRQRQRDYHRDGIGTKVCLRARDLAALLHVFELAQRRGLPAVLIEDSGRNTCFHGVPTITAVGIGPIAKHEFPELKRFQLLT